MIGRGEIDYRAHERLRVGMRMIHDNPVDQLGDRVDQRAFSTILDNQAAGRGAALSGG